MSGDGVALVVYLFLLLSVLALGIGLLAFSVWMVVDCLRRPSGSFGEFLQHAGLHQRYSWAAIIIVTIQFFSLGAIVYFFSVYRKYSWSSVDDATGQPIERTEPFAIAALVLSIITGPIGAIPAIICGHVAFARIQANPDLGGAGMAKAGLILGYGIVVLCILGFLLLNVMSKGSSPAPFVYTQF